MLPGLLGVLEKLIARINRAMVFFGMIALVMSSDRYKAPAIAPARREMQKPGGGISGPESPRRNTAPQRAPATIARNVLMDAGPNMATTRAMRAMLMR